MSVVLMGAVISTILGCSKPCKIYPPEKPVVNLPLELRQQNNWVGSGGQFDGSCVWATMISLLRWQGQYEIADYIRRNRAGGEFLGSVSSKLTELNIRFAVAENHDEEFLAWAIRTRRGAAVGIKKGKHMVAVVDIVGDEVCILDNRNVNSYIWIDKDKFFRDWHASGGWAFTPIYSPVSPLP